MSSWQNTNDQTAGVEWATVAGGVGAIISFELWCEIATSAVIRPPRNDPIRVDPRLRHLGTGDTLNNGAGKHASILTYFQTKVKKKRQKD